mgnify:CR=1 FL=1
MENIAQTKKDAIKGIEINISLIIPANIKTIEILFFVSGIFLSSIIYTSSFDSHTFHDKDYIESLTCRGYPAEQLVLHSIQ